MQVVWFKRDLRVQDHAALHCAARRGTVLPLYVVEPELWRQPDHSARHWEFVAETLAGLRQDLAQLGQPLIIRVGDMTDVLNRLLQLGCLDALWAHEETGNNWTFQRDKKVIAWCRSANVPFHQLQNHGVVRGLASRNGWADNWDRIMSRELTPPPALCPLNIAPGPIPDASDLGLLPDPCPERQVGGRLAGVERLSSFLSHRGETYQRAMSAPLAGAHACSRVSPYLTWGALSMREVYQACERRRAEIRSKGSSWGRSMRSFSGRLHWHCHFIQKLEDEPEIEFTEFHPLYAGLRPEQPDQTRLDAWANGETGYPFLDACMRSLRATGWLNFRMRAMVMSTASYHLWLDWRRPGQQLARFFTDYEPGIHWSQVQMQSGTTGINVARIYNPVKQGIDQDPTGVFTRRWVPELVKIPDQFLHEPWKADNAAEVLGKLYPEPIFDHVVAAREARDKIWGVRKEAGFQSRARAIQNKHGSRKSGIKNRGQRKPKGPSNQLELPF
ncbi:deoxyribodipyrimidine photo-lyase [Phaeobacter sp.]|uniref:FAD-binding domain-containing protein n=1 Tax=Phaeobacter sp. TaxID=1902409 RepID=UPI0025FE761C|nr:deoxyribodipyrimidine photo-lyase [Phaeobacter sp.]